VHNILSSSLLSENLKTKIYRTEIFCFVFSGFENWSLTLTDGRRLQVSENKVLGRICGPIRNGVTGDWRGLYNEDLNYLYFLTNIIRVIKLRRMKWAGRVARGEERCIEVWCGNLRRRTT
jgi:hypothetical protein